MKRNVYQRGVKGKKYGIWNASAKCWQFNIAEDTPMLAVARLHQKIGDDAKKWRFEPRILPDKLIKNGVILPPCKVGDTVYIIDYNKDGEAEDYSGYMFLAKINDSAVIVAPFAENYDTKDTIKYLIQETLYELSSDLLVFPIKDCYTTTEEAQKVLTERSK